MNWQKNCAAKNVNFEERRSKKTWFYFSVATAITDRVARCQMAYYQTQNPNLGKFWKVFGRYWCIFYVHLIYFVADWYIIW
jgi:hypothetical protein